MRDHRTMFLVWDLPPLAIETKTCFLSSPMAMSARVPRRVVAGNWE